MPLAFLLAARDRRCAAIPSRARSPECSRIDLTPRADRSSRIDHRATQDMRVRRLPRHEPIRSLQSPIHPHGELPMRSTFLASLALGTLALSTLAQEKPQEKPAATPE